jgi:MYXO-CTERM domain-containing protein
LSGATQFRLFHGSSAVYPGQNVAAQLGIDNVSAVPEPRQALLFVAGLLALGAGRWRRQQAVR